MKDGTCYACGGRVDAKGMAHGGEVDADAMAELEAPDIDNADGETSQMKGQKEMDRLAQRRFVRAVRGGR